MNEFAIATHDFEESKYQLKVFSEQTKTSPGLDNVDSAGGLFNLFDHKVTGYELNKLTTQIQNYLIDFNSLHTDLIKQFGEVYNTFEALDKDYMQAILISIKGVEKTNDGLKVAQKDIEKTIELQKKTISVLKQFKERLEKYKHLEDIDDIWNGFRKTQKDVSDIFDNVTEVAILIKNNTQEIKSINKFKEQIEKIKYIKDLDNLWNDSQKLKKDMSAIEKQIDNVIIKLENQSLSLAVLTQFKNKIDEYKHIDDIDNLWDDVVNLQEEIKSINIDVGKINVSVKGQLQSIEDLSEFKNELKRYEHLNEIDEIWDRCNGYERDITQTKSAVTVHQVQIEELKNSLLEMQKQNDERSKTFSKKLKITYILSSCGIGIAVIEFILLITRIM